ncbi:DUF6777 domain-containing protein [Streptomyces himalayensis]|uniref:DUF6777 domain-containing protein n=1 Tax=Streptomyces himalayensis subsp. himalayensis TaxID=2756131 RepID=A0A7W0I945_9ACTN|nr:DUF6777 domain-containing protein [Streptomyces himalayensis]MBA2947012.1 hypothetical protein [Streptomyces himalayensis subsp. himalayensis]
MRSPIRSHAAAFAISAALLVAGGAGLTGCTATGSASAVDGEEELRLQPVAEAGPDPFTDSTATPTPTPSPATRSPEPPTPSGTATADVKGRSVDGSTPGLYGGTLSESSCDVEKQVRFLTTDQAKARAFARVVGVAQADVATYLRGLTPVVLRTDTRVTNHGFRDGQANGFQAVLQAGTAVLVDDRGLPRVRCACGNPLKSPVATRTDPVVKGQPWQGYRPAQVVVVTPAPKIIVNITIVNIVNNTWIERKAGDDGDRDRTVPPPATPSPTTPSPETPSPTTPSPETPSPTTPSPESPGPTTPSPDDTSSPTDSPPASPPSPPTPPTRSPEESPPDTDRPSPDDDTESPPEDLPDGPTELEPRPEPPPARGTQGVPDGGVVPLEPLLPEDRMDALPESRPDGRPARRPDRPATVES